MNKIDKRKIIGISGAIMAMCIFAIGVYVAIRESTMSIDILDILLFVGAFALIISAIRTRTPVIMISVFMFYSFATVTMINEYFSTVFMINLGIFAATISWLIYALISIVKPSENSEG